MAGKAEINYLNQKLNKKQDIAASIKMAVGTCTVSCQTKDDILGKYVGQITIDRLTNFVNGCVVIPIEAGSSEYSNGVCDISVGSDNWIRVNSPIATNAYVRCLLLYL